MNADQLRDALRAVREKLSSDHAVRLHRAISWLKCAENYSDDDDITLVALWIAFNACYGIEESQNDKREKGAIQSIFRKDQLT
ncbi:MAG: hypothetical protein R3F50_21530 [Gammaproteobacteria bacterium]